MEKLIIKKLEYQLQWAFTKKVSISVYKMPSKRAERKNTLGKNAQLITL
jgi:hypothetical protein